MPDNPIRVLLVDDHAIVLEGLRNLIDGEDEFEVVGEAGTVEAAIRRVGLDEPDVVVMDVHLPDGTGVEACREIVRRWPHVQVVILSSFADDAALHDAILAGASGYVLKRIRTEQLLDALRTAAAGKSLLDPDLVDLVFQRIRDGDDRGDPLLSRLSAQERRVLEHIANGLTNRQIAGELGLAEKTVKNYVSNLLTKMEMSRRTEAAAYVAEKRGEGAHRFPAADWS